MLITAKFLGVFWSTILCWSLRRLWLVKYKHWLLLHGICKDGLLRNLESSLFALLDNFLGRRLWLGFLLHLFLVIFIIGSTPLGPVRNFELPYPISIREMNSFSILSLGIRLIGIFNKLFESLLRNVLVKNQGDESWQIELCVEAWLLRIIFVADSYTPRYLKLREINASNVNSS